MQRILIIGGPGAGKTTLARALADRTGLPLTEADDFLAPVDGRSPQIAASVAKVNRAGEDERWIIEGAWFARSITAVEAADTCIWLDLPVPIRIWGILCRVLSGRCRKFPGRNRVFRLYNQRRILWKAWWFRRRSRSRAARLLARAPEHAPRYRLRSRHEIARFVATLG